MAGVTNPETNCNTRGSCHNSTQGSRGVKGASNHTSQPPGPAGTAWLRARGRSAAISVRQCPCERPATGERTRTALRRKRGGGGGAAAGPGRSLPRARGEQTSLARPELLPPPTSTLHIHLPPALQTAPAGPGWKQDTRARRAWREGRACPPRQGLRAAAPSARLLCFRCSGQSGAAAASRSCPRGDGGSRVKEKRP